MARAYGRAVGRQKSKHRRTSHFVKCRPTTNVLAMPNVVKSPVVGSVWKIQVAVGDNVAEDDDLIILESMKMEIPVEAETSGVITAINVAEGDQVAEGDTLATIG